MHKAEFGEKSAGLSMTSGPQQRVRGDRAATSALAGSTCVSVRTKVIFFFFAASAAPSAAVTGKGNALLRCCSAVGERERQREGGSSDTA